MTEPTATCGETRPHDAHEGDRGYGDEPNIDWVHWTCRGVPAEPPRIEDMAPGTTFVQAVMWTVAVSDRGEKYARRPAGRFGSQIITDHDIDPSTIRDVTPPKDAA